MYSSRAQCISEWTSHCGVGWGTRTHQVDHCIFRQCLNVVSLLLPLLPRECEIQSQMLSGNEFCVLGVDDHVESLRAERLWHEMGSNLVVVDYRYVTIIGGTKSQGREICHGGWYCSKT